jgi:hypothetical protein
MFYIQVYSLQVCVNSQFVASVLCCTLSTVRSMFDVHDISTAAPLTLTVTSLVVSKLT